MFIKLTEVFIGKERPVLLNTDMITDIAPFANKNFNTVINLLTMDGENNPAVFHIKETFEEVEALLKGA